MSRSPDARSCLSIANQKRSERRIFSSSDETDSRAGEESESVSTMQRPRITYTKVLH